VARKKNTQRTQCFALTDPGAVSGLRAGDFTRWQNGTTPCNNGLVASEPPPLSLLPEHTGCARQNIM